MRTRPLTPDDAPSCAAIAAERGWRPHAESWRVAIGLGRGCGVDVAGDGLAAAAVLVDRGGRAGVLSVLVSPRHAGRGLGRAVAEAVLREAGPLPVELHSPPAGLPFAARLGFVPAGAATRFVGQPTPGGPVAPSLGLRPVSGSDFPALVAIDEVAYGALRRPLLEAIFPMAVRACLATAGGRTVGYGLAWAEGEQLAIGPIVAEEDETAAAMLGWLAGSGDREVRVDVPTERTAVAGAARAVGLAPAGQITRLVRGGDAGGRRERIQALAAPWAG